MELQNNSDLEAWENLISGVNKSDIPLPFVNTVIIELEEADEDEGDSFTLDLKGFRDEGLTEELIETVVRATMSAYQSNIKNVGFLIDVETVATTVQLETNKILSKI